MNFGGFSWRRFIGLTAAKARISKVIGIPLTRSGRNQKIGRMVTRGDCLVVLLLPLVLIVAGTRLFIRLFRHIK